jgi:hypothetical protein
MAPTLARGDSSPSDKDENTLSQSHVLIPLHGMDLQQALAERVQALKEASEAKKSLQELLKNPPEFLKNKEKVDQFYELFNKGRLPLDAKLLRELQESFGHHQMDLPAEQQEKVRHLIDEFRKRNAEYGMRNEGEANSLPPEKTGGPTPLEDPAGLEARRGSFPPPRPPSGDSEAEPNVQEKIARWLADHVDMEEGSWADSPALRETIRELRRPHLETGDWLGLDENSWSGKFAGLSRSMLQSRWWPEMDWSRFAKVIPSPRIDLPKVDMPRPRSPINMPNITLPAATTLNRGLELLWVALIVMLAVAVWKFLRAQSAERSGRKGRAWKLGPWPVSPSAVASREQLILAFEYLSLLKLGPAARNRNHLALAAALGGKQEEGHRAADHLAALYELARYAPDPDPIPDEAFTAARRELCYLAETASV